jgi:hypothetical protein
MRQNCRSAIDCGGSIMPFDGSGFFLAPAAPPKLAWSRRLAAALRGALEARPWRRAPEPLDAAVLRVLAEARSLIELREDWTQGTLETVRGERCAVGAVRLAAEFFDYAVPGRIALDWLGRVAAARGYASIEAMNDRSRHAQVLSAFDAAIAAYVDGTTEMQNERIGADLVKRFGGHSSKEKSHGA